MSIGKGLCAVGWYVVGSSEEQGRKEMGGRETENEKDKEGERRGIGREIGDGDG
jgi:hypothetical protein